jgi:hypothetical protein
MFGEFLAAHLGLLYELSGVIVLLVAVIGRYDQKLGNGRLK